MTKADNNQAENEKPADKPAGTSAEKESKDQK